MWTSAFYNHWDYWDLDHKVTFDGPNKLIRIAPGITSLDVQVDLYSDWKEWAQLRDNTKYVAAFEAVGGDPTVNNQALDATFFLINGWRLLPYPGEYDLALIGNLFERDGGSIKVPPEKQTIRGQAGSNNISFNLNTSVVVRTLTPQVSISGSVDANVTASLGPTDRGLIVDISGSVVEILSRVNTLQSTVNTVSSSVNTVNSNVTSVDTKVTDIQTTLANPITASLEPTQEALLNSIQVMLQDVWRIHGLDSGSLMTVTRTERTVADISQSINTTGTGSGQQTTVQRL